MLWKSDEIQNKYSCIRDAFIKIYIVMTFNQDSYFSVNRQPPFIKLRLKTNPLVQESR